MTRAEEGSFIVLTATLVDVTSTYFGTWFGGIVELAGAFLGFACKPGATRNLWPLPRRGLFFTATAVFAILS